MRQEIAPILIHKTTLIPYTNICGLSINPSLVIERLIVWKNILLTLFTLYIGKHILIATPIGVVAIKVAHYISTNGVSGAERWVLAFLKHLPSDSILLYSSTDNNSLGLLAESLDIECVVIDVRHNYDFYLTISI